MNIPKNKDSVINNQNNSKNLILDQNNKHKPLVLAQSNVGMINYAEKNFHCKEETPINVETYFKGQITPELNEISMNLINNYKLHGILKLNDINNNSYHLIKLA